MTTDLTHYTSEAITLLSSLISIPSISREEDKAADFLQTYIEESGIMTGRSGNNIWCISPMFDIHKPTILLNSHIDTVKPVNGWRKQPFTAKMDNGKLYGLGSNDAGASVVSLFQAYRHLSATEQAYNLIFCIIIYQGTRLSGNTSCHLASPLSISSFNAFLLSKETKEPVTTKVIPCKFCCSDSLCSISIVSSGNNASSCLRFFSFLK